MLSFLTSSVISPEQDACLKALASIEYVDQDKEQKALMLSAIEGMANGLELEELVRLTSLILLRRFESGKNPTELFSPHSFAYHLTKIVLIKLEYPLGKDGASDVSFKMRNPGTFSTIVTTNHPVEIDFDQAELNHDIPSLVLTLLTPCFHKIDLKQSEAKRRFMVAFSKAFFFDALLDPASATIEAKVALSQKAQRADLFLELTTKLEWTRKSYQPVRVSQVGFFVTAFLSEKESQMATLFQRGLKLCEDLVVLGRIFKEMASTFELLSSAWQGVYKTVSEELAASLINLTTLTQGKSSEQLSQIYHAIAENLSKLLTRVINNPLNDVTLLINLTTEMAPLLRRVTELSAIFTMIAQAAVKESPAHQFYANGVVVLHKHLEDSMAILIYNVAILDKAQRDEMLKGYHAQLSRLLTPYIDNKIDDLTPLHRMVMQTFQDNEAQRTLKAHIERLLLEGFDLKATTTNYKNGPFTFLTKKSPIDVAQLAELYGNAALLEQAKQSAEIRKARADLDAVFNASDSGEGLFSIASRAAEAAVAIDTTIPGTELPLQNSGEGRGTKRAMGTACTTPVRAAPAAASETTLVGMSRSSAQSSDAAKKRIISDDEQRAPDTVMDGDQSAMPVTRTSPPSVVTVRRIVRR